jgi:hypothetical protein
MRFATTSVGFAGLAALAALTIALPLVGSGCGRTACFVYTKGEYDAHGSCPAQAAALTNFTDPHCPGPVLTVDGAGVFSLNSTNPDQSLCCYSVTQEDLEQNFSDTCTPPTGAGGAGGFSSQTGSFEGSTSFVAVGVGGANMGCFTCNEELMGLGNNPAQLCPGTSADAWGTLDKCACGGACAGPCNLNLCVGAPMSKECFVCLDTPSSSGCAMELMNCEGT